MLTSNLSKNTWQVLRKGAMLKGSSVTVTEDLSRRIRQCRAELRKFMRDVKKGNPAATVHLQYDKLYVDGKCFVWNDHRGKVTELSALDVDLGNERPGSVLDRSASSFSLAQTTTRRTPSALARCQSLGSGLGTPMDSLQQDSAEELLAERDDMIRQLQETVNDLKEKLKACEMENPAQDTDLPQSDQ